MIGIFFPKIKKKNKIVCVEGRMYAYTLTHMWMQMLAEPRDTELELQAAAYQLGTDAGMEGTKAICKRSVCS